MGKFITIGGTQFNPSAMEGMDYEAFKKQYKGKLAVDIREAWKVLRREIPRKPVKKTPSKKKGKKTTGK